MCDFDVLLFGSSKFREFCYTHDINKSLLERCIVHSNDSHTRLHVLLDDCEVILAIYDNDTWVLMEGEHFYKLQEVSV